MPKTLDAEIYDLFGQVIIQLTDSSLLMKVNIISLMNVGHTMKYTFILSYFTLEFIPTTLTKDCLNVSCLTFVSKARDDLKSFQRNLPEKKSHLFHP